MKPKTTCLIFFLGLPSCLWGADPFEGTWKLNVEKIKVITGLPPKEGTIIAKREGDHYVFEENDTFGNGTHVVMRYTEPIDGGPVRYVEGGQPADVSEVVKRLNSTTKEYRRTRAGKVIFTAQVVANKDGKNLTMHSKGTNAQGKLFDRIEVWDRR